MIFTAAPFDPIASPMSSSGQHASGPRNVVDVARRVSGPRQAAAVAFFMIVLLIVVAAWSGTRATESSYLQALDVDLNEAATALEVAAAENEERIRDAALWHDWLEQGEPAGSGSLMDAAKRLATPGEIDIPARAHRDLIATGR